MPIESPHVVEVGPRDGLQNERVALTVSQKIEFIERVVAAGARRVEAVSFVDPRRVPQMADADAVMAGVARDSGVSWIGLVLNARGLERAIDAGVDEANVVVVATDTFSLRNQGTTTHEMVRLFDALATRAHDAGLRVTLTIGAAFGCPFEGEVAVARVRDLAAAGAAAGADEIALADTIGVAVPRDVHRLVAAVRDVADAPLRVHLHNTRNTGYANAVAAVDAGVGALDASAGGIGGCPFAPNATGNIASEDLAYLLRRSGLDTGVDIGRMTDAARFVGDALGIATPALLGRAGDFPGTRTGSEGLSPAPTTATG